jgi:hypothetical protein
MVEAPAPSPGPRAFPWFAGAIVGLFVAYLGVALYFVRAGIPNQDEGWYLHAARLVWEGRLPYRDFAFFQAPLLPYLYGFGQQLLGAGVEAGRLTSMALGAGTAALGTRLAFEGGGRLGALFFLSLLSLTPIAVWAFTTTRTEPVTAFLWMLSVFLMLRSPPSRLAVAGALLAGALAASARISSLPGLGVVLLWAWLRDRESRRGSALMLVPVAAVGLAGGLLLVAAGWEAVFFNVVTAQAERHEQLASAAPWGAAEFAARRLGDLGLLQRFYGVVAITSLLAGGALVAGVLDRRRSAPPLAPKALAVVGVSLAVYLPNLVPRAVFPVYFSPVVPLLLVLAAWAIGRLHELASGRGRAAVVAAALGIVALQAAHFADRRHLYLAPESGPRIQAVARLLARRMPPGRTLATMDTYLAVESGLRLEPGYEMGLFSYFPSRSDADVERLRVLNAKRLADGLGSGRPGAVVLSDRALGILTEASWAGSRRVPWDEVRLRAELPGLAGYRLLRTFPDVGQFRDHLYLLVPAAR